MKEINAANVQRLGAAWVFPIPNTQRVLQVTPVVVSGVMYVTAVNEAQAGTRLDKLLLEAMPTLGRAGAHGALALAEFVLLVGDPGGTPHVDEPHPVHRAGRCNPIPFGRHCGTALSSVNGEPR